MATMKSNSVGLLDNRRDRNMIFKRLFENVEHTSGTIYSVSAPAPGRGGSTDH